MLNYIAETSKMFQAVTNGRELLNDEQLEKCERWDAVAMRCHELGRPLDDWEVALAANGRTEQLAADGLIKHVDCDTWIAVDASAAGKAVWGDILADAGVKLDQPTTPVQIVADAINAAKAAIEKSMDENYYGAADYRDVDMAFDDLRLMNKNAEWLAALATLVAGDVR